MYHNFFLPENGAYFEIVWGNMVQSDRPQMPVQYGACALLSG